MMNFTPYVVLLIGMTVFCSISAIVILGAVRAHAFFGNSSHCFRTNRNSSTTIKQDLSTLEQSLKFEITDDEDKNPDVVPNKKGNFVPRDKVIVEGLERCRDIIRLQLGLRAKILNIIFRRRGSFFPVLFNI